MSALKTVPKFRGKGIHIWLGLVLLVLLVEQATSGFMMVGGNFGLRPLHVLNAMILLVVATVHAYFGIGLHFFGFRLKK